MLRNVGLFCPHFIFLWRCSIKKTQINEEITAEKVRLIGPDGNQIGIVSSKIANNQAIVAKMDLVMIAPNANPPVCKIMDFGKYRYEQQKQLKEAKKKQKTVQVKEIRLSVNIDEHDLQTKARHARKFLENGDRLKLSLRYKGRQLGRREQGFEVVNNFYELIKDIAEVDKKPKYEGRSLVAYYSPIKD